MSRRLVVKKGKMFIDNDFQTRFVFEEEQVDDVYSILSYAKQNTDIVTPESGRISERSVLASCGDIKLVPPNPTKNAVITLYNEKNNSTMFYRNTHQISGIMSILEEYVESPKEPIEQ